MVFHSDHGFHLGDGGTWCKQTTTETGTRVPLLIALPFPSPPSATVREEIVELVDVYPTMLEVARLPTPDGPALPGRSLVPLLPGATQSQQQQQQQQLPPPPAFALAFAHDDEELQSLLAQLLPRESGMLGHGTAFSQYPRCASTPAEPSSLADRGFAFNRQCMMLPNDRIAAMGYAVRVHGWRYAEWYAYDAATWMPQWNATGGLLGAELYAMDGEPREAAAAAAQQNVVKEEAAVARVLSRVLQLHFWPLLRPKGARDAAVSPAVAASRWASPPPPGKGDAVVVDEAELKEAWGGGCWENKGAETAAARD